MNDPHEYGPNTDRAQPTGTSTPTVHGLARAYLFDQATTAVVLIFFTAVTFTFTFTRSNEQDPLGGSKVLFAVVTVVAWVCLLIGAMISCLYWSKDRGSSVLLSGSRKALKLIAMAVAISSVGIVLVLLSEIIWVASVYSETANVRWWNYLAIVIIILALLYMVYQNYRLLKQVIYYYGIARDVEAQASGYGTSQYDVEAENGSRPPNGQEFSTSQPVYNGGGPGYDRRDDV